MLEVFIRRSCRNTSEDDRRATRDGDNVARASEVLHERAGAHTARASEVSDERAGAHTARASEVSDERAGAHTARASGVSDERAGAQPARASEVSDERAGAHTARASEVSDERAGAHTARASEVSDERVGDTADHGEVVSLDYEQRQRSRLRITTSWGREIALKLPRGTVLEDGDQLQLTDGSTVRVIAACERLSRVECSSATELARVAYHLGNRHVALEVGEGYVAYQRDHVLDGMLNRLGLRTDSIYLPFSPEPGAYQGHDWGNPSVTYVGSSPLLQDGSGA